MKHKHKKRSRETSSSSDTDSSDDKNYKKRNSREKIKTKVKDKKKRKRCSSTDSSPSSTEHKRKKAKKEKRKKVKSKRNSALKFKTKNESIEKTDSDCFDVPLDLMNASSSMVPMTKSEWDKRQSTVRRVFDESTGRHRLIKGDGEVIEEIVTRDRHKEINKQATSGDGMYFQTMINNKTNK